MKGSLLLTNSLNVISKAGFMISTLVFYISLIILLRKQFASDPLRLNGSLVFGFFISVQNWLYWQLIANFVLSYICSLLLYLQHIILVNMKLDISNRITFQDN